MARQLTERDIERGRRVRAIREALGLTQDAIVGELNDTAKRMGLPATYRYYTVSRMESGSIGFEDAAVWIALDPEGRDWEWFVFGTTRKTVLRRISGGHGKG